MVTKFAIVTIQIGIELLSMGFNTEQSAEWDQKRSVTTHFPGVLTNEAIGDFGALLRPAEICWTLKISEKTFEKHIKGAKEKLRASTRDHAVAKSLVLGLIQP